LSPADLERLLFEIMESHHQHELSERLSVDFAYAVPELGRFRCAVHRHVFGIAAVMRVVPSEIIPMQDLGLPEQIGPYVQQPSGLILVTGPTGSGKSTTLASIIDYINENRNGHIITIEDPIEFVHSYKRSVITQREIGPHSPSFAEALRNGLREDPDTILVGEMRDLETIGLALTAAETGIQVFGTLHTNGAVRTVDRVVNVFPHGRQDQVRSMLSESLRMVISQQLVPLASGRGRKAALEVLVNTQASSSLIRAGKANQLTSVIQSGKSVGMQSLDTQLLEDAQEGIITGVDAYTHAIDKAKFEHLVAREAA
jgi:twitching motility protein PilT